MAIPSLVDRKKEDEKINYNIVDVSQQNYFKSFPSEEDLIQIFPDAFVINRPMQGVGGDGFWLYQNNADTYLVVFDCMGHGRLASIMTRKYVNLIEKVIRIDNFTDPGTILNRIHEEIESSFSEVKAQVGSGADIAVFKYTRKTHQVCFAGAKMDLMVLNDGETSIIKADKLQVGEIFDVKHEYNTVPLKLPKKGKTSFYLFSDGVTDQMGGEKNKKFGKSRLQNLILTSSNVNIKEQKEIINTEFYKWKSENEQTDDMLILGFTI